MMKYSFDYMYERVRANDNTYDGLFFTCVKSTQVFCVPSCKAKTPLKKNIEFVNTANEALKKGYRPCKRCHPLNKPFFTPDWLNEVKQFLMTNLNRRVPDTELADLVNQDISTIRRYFKTQHGLLIKDFHRKNRLEKASELLSNGMKESEVASLVGYHSVKGFKLAYTKQFGKEDNNEHRG